MPEPHPQDPSIPSCHGALSNLDEEHDYQIEEIEGTVPQDLAGTFYRNGPGRQQIGSERYGHWFDGDGMISAFRIAQGTIRFKNRYVRTPKYQDETAAQQICHRGFGTQIPGGLRKNLFKVPANPANTHSVLLGQKLLALYEGGHPFALDPATLETIGDWDFDGVLQPGDVMSAHGRYHPQSGDYISFGTGMEGFGLKGPKPCLRLYRVNEAGALYRRHSIALETAPFCHDFAITEHYALFFLGSIVFANPLPILFGVRSFSDLIRYDRSVPMTVLAVDLDSLEVAARFETEPGTVIHFGNAYEADQQIIVDGMFASDFDANETLKNVFNPSGRFNGGEFRRYRLDLQSRHLGFEIMASDESEFPTYNPAWTGQRHQVTYSAASVPNGASSFFNALQRTTDEGTQQRVVLEKGCYGSEPVFAPRIGATAEDDGYLLSVVYDAHRHRSRLEIRRAEDLGECVATAHLRHHLPHQFHGLYCGEAH